MRINESKYSQPTRWNNVFKEKELEQVSVCKEPLLTAHDCKNYKTYIYNLDVIISVGYRVKSQRGTQFRIWANKILKNYLLKGYAIRTQFEQIAKKIQQHDTILREHDQKFDLLIKTSLPPNECIFYDGQIFDAYKFVADIVNLERFNSQYPKIEIKVFYKSHDRFLIIDNKTAYHIGASLKDLGKKWFAFAKINLDVAEMSAKLERIK